jgi:hypothetical protein
MTLFDVMQYVFEKKISIKFAQTMVHCNICTRDRKKIDYWQHILWQSYT